MNRSSLADALLVPMHLRHRAVLRSLRSLRTTDVYEVTLRALDDKTEAIRLPKSRALALQRNGRLKPCDKRRPPNSPIFIPHRM